MARPQTLGWQGLALISALLTAGCATVVEQSKRDILRVKCVEKVVPLIQRLGALSPVRVERTPEFCSCMAQGVDLDRAEAVARQIERIGPNVEALLFLNDHAPLLARCARESGVVPAPVVRERV